MYTIFYKSHELNKIIGIHTEGSFGFGSILPRHGMSAWWLGIAHAMFSSLHDPKYTAPVYCTVYRMVNIQFICQILT